MSEPRWLPEYRIINGVRTTVTSTKDPAYELLANPNIYSTPNESIFNDRCYICLDPEFAQMGLPLCYPCELCGGHVPADDVACDVCGADQEALYYERTSND